MKNASKYQRQYFMPPEPCFDWVKKEYIEKTANLVQCRFKRWKSGTHHSNESGRKTGIFPGFS